MTNNILTKDDKTILIFAFRYALPRKTYALDLVSERIFEYINQFENWEIGAMITDCKYQYHLIYSSADKTSEYMDSRLMDIGSLSSKLQCELDTRNLKSENTERK
jgi:hypothetical protein